MANENDGSFSKNYLLVARDIGIEAMKLARGNTTLALASLVSAAGFCHGAADLVPLETVLELFLSSYRDGKEIAAQPTTPEEFAKEELARKLRS